MDQLRLTAFAEPDHREGSRDPVEHVVTDTIERAQALFARAQSQGVGAKLLGGIGCWLHVADGQEDVTMFSREYHDIDFMVHKKSKRNVSAMFEEEGYEPARSFNAVHGETRLLFLHPSREDLRVDVFLGEFAMCHVVPVPDAAYEPPDHPSLRMEELLLTKLQVVNINEKDLLDVAGLVAMHALGGRSDEIDATRVAKPLAADWGLWRTVTGNLEKVAGWASREVPDRGVAERIGALLEAVDDAPKSTRWKMRARVGERVAWYDQPDEPDANWTEVR